MDERQLETLFREAPGEPPTAGFSADDVVRASKRATARRRNALAAGAACLVLVLAGAGVATYAGNLLGGQSDNAASAPQIKSNSELGMPRQPGSGAGRPPNTTGFPSTSPKQGGEGSGENGPRAESTAGCEKVDRELATALAGELPVTALPPASPGRVCTRDSRAAGFAVRDGAASGVVSVTVLPAGTTAQLPPQPPGTVDVEQRGASGGTVWVLSVPDTGTTAAPFGGEVQRIAQALAARY